MSYSIIASSDAVRDAKHLSKKYASFKADLAALIDSLSTQPMQGESLGKGCYKIRLAIKSKNRGKSGGVRVITYVQVVKEVVYLLALYDKSEVETITNTDLDDRLNNLS